MPQREGTQRCPPPPSLNSPPSTSSSELASIYDVFAEAYSDAQATSAEAQDHARTQAERELWAARGFALADFRRSVDPDDRLAIIEAIVMLGTEVDAIRAYLDRSTAAA